MLRWVAIVLFAMALSGCDSPRQASTSGDRLLSLSPGLTEVVVALGQGHRLVGRSNYCDYPPEVLDLPMAGSSLAPDFEAVARLNPDLVLIEAHQTSHRADLERLADIEELPWLELAEVTASIRALGRRLGVADAAEALAGRFETELSEAPPADGPRVLLTLGANVDGSPIWYIRRNSLHGAVLHAAGGRNAVEHDVRGNASLGIEALLELDPDLIIALLPEAGEEQTLRQQVVEAFGQLQTLSAVQGRRIGVVPGAGFLRSGPRTLDLVPRLRAEIERLQPDPGR